MPGVNDTSSVRQQYTNADGLQVRMRLHQKYSANKQPYGEWIAEHYHIQPGMKVLELGCGTGSMWQGVVLPDACHVTLTDLSAGMLETARQNTAHLCADYAVCDAMALPYGDATFDVVIANMMLYHVPDIGRALSEIRRVLKPAGRFFAATFGEHGAVEAVLDMLGLPCTANHRFTLQNGTAQLEKHFGDVRIASREDALDVTHLPDLIAYLRSMQGMTVLADVPDEQLLAAFTAYQKDGVLSLPKEYGLFICQ